MTERDLCYTAMVENLQRSFRSGMVRTCHTRESLLRQLHQMITQHESQFYEAAYKDLRKSQSECELLEICQVRAHLSNAVANLEKLSKVKQVKPDLANVMNKCQIRQDPLGVALIISSWYAPFTTSLIPLIAALSAGNCVLLKLSQLSSNTSSLLEQLLTQYVSSDIVQVVIGDEPEMDALLQERFDVIYHSETKSVGKMIMRAASEHLTPVVHGVRGKCPVVVDSSCNMDIVARSIAWGKFTNCGQTPHAPDFVICVNGCDAEFLKSMKVAISKIFGEDATKSENYGRIVSREHFVRISRLIDPLKVVFGNERDEDDLFLSPTIMNNVTEGDLVMEEEVFGPLLPILSAKSLQSAVDFINCMEKASHLYVFSNDKSSIEFVTKETLFGGNVYVNNMLGHIIMPNLLSAGAAVFRTFSHSKSYLSKSQGLEAVNTLRYPPYNPSSNVLKVAEWAITPKVKKRSTKD